MLLVTVEIRGRPPVIKLHMVLETLSDSVTLYINQATNIMLLYNTCDTHVRHCLMVILLAAVYTACTCTMPQNHYYLLSAVFCFHQYALYHRLHMTKRVIQDSVL